MTESTIRGVLFDKDGTLLDFDATWPPAYRAMADALAALAGDPDLAARLLRLGGYGGDGALDPGSVFACGTTAEIVDFCAARPELAGVDDVAGVVDGLFMAFGGRGPPVIDNLAEVIEVLRGRGLALGIATNDGAASAAAWLAYQGMERYFDFVSGADSGHGAKPDPAVLAAFCAATGLEPGEVAVVGDAVKDAELARAGGAGLAVIVRTGVSDGDALAALCDAVIESVAGLEALLWRSGSDASLPP